MNYNGKKVAITGSTGFIGSALVRALEAAGANVYPLGGDTRNPRTFERLDYSFDYLFHFAAPSSQIIFKRQPRNSVDVTINGFLNAMEACRKNGVKLIYPSTGLLSGGDTNEYARCKKICEDIAQGASVDTLGIRIFATYGPGEGHKRDYASVPYLFMRDMRMGKSPQVWGDGSQSRDFIYIDDTIMGIMTLAEEATEAVVDLGSGETSSFSRVLQILMASFGAISGAKIPAPTFTGSPAGYVESTKSDISVLRKYYYPGNELEDGIYRMVKTELGND